MKKCCENFTGKTEKLLSKHNHWYMGCPHCKAMWLEETYKTIQPRGLSLSKYKELVQKLLYEEL